MATRTGSRGTKSSQRKATATARSTTTTSKRTGAQPRQFADLDITTEPPSQDPEAQATWFVSLLDQFAQHGSPEATRIRAGLVETISEYHATQGKVVAKAVAIARIAGLQAGVAELVLRSTRKMRDRFVKESRRAGTSSKDGKALRAAAHGFSTMVEGLEMMVAAAETGDEALSARGGALMDKARTDMEPYLPG